MPEPKFTVVIPAFNEEAHLEENVRSLIAVLAEQPGAGAWEIILVNDGSTDGTLAAIEKLAAENEGVRSVSYKKNRGRGYALRAGFEQARGGIVVSTEADMTWGPDIVPRLVRALEEGEYDIVVASPYAEGGRLENVPFRRALVSRMGNRFLTSTLPVSVSMVSGMTRAYRREALDALELESDGKEFHVEVISKAAMLGYSIGEIPAVLRWKKTKKGEPKRRSSLSIRRMVTGHLAHWAIEKPIFIFGFLGLLLLALGIAGGIYITELRFAGGLNPERPLMTLVVILILAGMQILAFGFIAILIGKLRGDIIRVQRENRTILKRLKDRG
ncbi:MAG: glycosyltransferase [Chitinivibrionia bacterium]|nr:glycosyltransferase [Chitinivibrionia bacterium]